MIIFFCPASAVLLLERATCRLLIGRIALLPQPEQRKHFIETARELGIPDTEAAQENAFGKVESKKRRATNKK